MLEGSDCLRMTVHVTMGEHTVSVPNIPRRRRAASPGPQPPAWRRSRLARLLATAIDDRNLKTQTLNHPPL